MGLLPFMSVAGWDAFDAQARLRDRIMATLTELRRQYEGDPENLLVSADIYISQLTGRERLVRADEPSANLLGLMDEMTGSRILVPVEEFVRKQADFRLCN